jgi:hypothetical protein
MLLFAGPGATQPCDDEKNIARNIQLHSELQLVLVTTSQFRKTVWL